MPPLLLNETAVIGMASLLLAVAGAGVLIGLVVGIGVLGKAIRAKTGSRVGQLFRWLFLIGLLLAFGALLMLVIMLFQVGLSD